MHDSLPAPAGSVIELMESLKLLYFRQFNLFQDYIFKHHNMHNPLKHKHNLVLEPLRNSDDYMSNEKQWSFQGHRADPQQLCHVSHLI